MHMNLYDQEVELMKDKAIEVCVVFKLYPHDYLSGTDSYGNPQSGERWRYEAITLIAMRERLKILMTK